VIPVLCEQQLQRPEDRGSLQAGGGPRNARSAETKTARRASAKRLYRTAPGRRSQTGSAVKVPASVHSRAQGAQVRGFRRNSYLTLARHPIVSVVGPRSVACSPRSEFRDKPTFSVAASGEGSTGFLFNGNDRGGGFAFSLGLRARASAFGSKHLADTRVVLLEVVSGGCKEDASKQQESEILKSD
jgi:hypothetical protein